MLKINTADDLKKKTAASVCLEHKMKEMKDLYCEDANW